jgi:hypothetical protein
MKGMSALMGSFIPALDLTALLPPAVDLPASEAVGRVRDLVLMRTGELALVIACDSNASIGAKPADALAQDPGDTGYSAAKVPLMEVLAAGARPVLLVNNLCCELEPSGHRLLQGIHRVLAEAGLDVVVTGSDETNMPTVQTGIGVTVLGIAGRDDLRCGSAEPGDVVWCVGTPRDGLQLPIVDGSPGIAGPRQVRAALATPGVHEVLPVGSRGVRYEAGQLADAAGLVYRPADRTPIDLDVSAGPSTCVLVAAPMDVSAALAGAVHPCSVAPVGELLEAESPRHR